MGNPEMVFPTRAQVQWRRSAGPCCSTPRELGTRIHAGKMRLLTLRFDGLRSDSFSLSVYPSAKQACLYKKPLSMSLKSRMRPLAEFCFSPSDAISRTAAENDL